MCKDPDGNKFLEVAIVACRYQQFRAANKIIERLRHGQNATDKSGFNLYRHCRIETKP